MSDFITGTSIESGTVSYSYIILGKAGDRIEGKTTLHLQEGEYATDVYEVGDYKIGEPIYTSENSKITSVSGNGLVGYVTKTPTIDNPFLNFYLKTQPSRRKK